MALTALTRSAEHLMYAALAAAPTPPPVATGAPAGGGIPDPGTGQPPPGAPGFLLLLGFLAWLAFAACVAAVLKSGGLMGWSSAGHGGGSNQHTISLGWAVAGAIVTGSAASIITVVVAAGS